MKISRLPFLAGAAALAGPLAASVGPIRAAVIDNPDRVTLAAWAAAEGVEATIVEDLYAATGVVTCSWEHPTGGIRSTFASAQLTMAADLITLSGHTFIDPFTCEPKAEAAECLFTINHGGVEETSPLAELLGTGIHCGPEASSRLFDRMIGDWAVARLVRPLGATPYEVDPTAGGAVAPAAPVLSVTHSQDYFTIAADGTMLHPKTIGSCRVRDILRRLGTLAYFTTDCDGAQRSSGGSILAAGGEGPPKLIAIWAASTEGRQLLDEAVARMVAAGAYRDDLANTGTYEVNGWSSRHIPISGEFLSVLLLAANGDH